MDSRSRRFTLERVFGERGCQEHFRLRGLTSMKRTMRGKVIRNENHPDPVCSRKSRGYTQREERGGLPTSPRRHSMKCRRVSTVIAAFNISIICSRLNPACSPAIASLQTACADEGRCISHPLRCEKKRARLNERLRSPSQVVASPAIRLLIRCLTAGAFLTGLYCRCSIVQSAPKNPSAIEHSSRRVVPFVTSPGRAF